MGYEIRRSGIGAASGSISLTEAKSQKKLAYVFLEPGDEVITVLFLLEARESHLGTGNVLAEVSIAG